MTQVNACVGQNHAQNSGAFSGVAKSVPAFIMSARMDVNFWGLIVVPLGLVICFAPILIAAIRTKPNDGADKPQKD